MSSESSTRSARRPRSCAGRLSSSARASAPRVTCRPTTRTTSCTTFAPSVTLAALILLFGGYAPVGTGMLLTGLAGMLAVACSTALGEWVSLTSSRKLEEREIRIESNALAEDPEGEELKLIYEAKGLH